MDRYIYPAIFEKDEDGYSVTFPDLPGCITCGDNLEDAYLMAKDALELHLYGMEEDNDKIPSPSKPENISVNSGTFVTLIEAYMPLIREEMANKAIKKTLTIPKWLNDLGEDKKVNFSQILQKALKENLGVYDYSNKKNKSKV
ncbi:MAG: type II toxin-antitoxin system HicB family antitoxin [Peptococcia bacterium]|jgi:predicted RNase H-like HicB family nuclease